MMRRRARDIAKALGLLLAVTTSSMCTPGPTTNPSITATCVSPLPSCATATTFSEGSTVSVSGSGFSSSTNTAIWLETGGDGKLDFGEPSVQVLSDGSGSINAALAVSGVPAGAYTIQAGTCLVQPTPPPTPALFRACQDPANPTTGAASTPVVINLSSAPSSMGSGTNVNITGFGFPAGSINVWLDAGSNNIDQAPDDMFTGTTPADDLAGSDTTVTAVAGPSGAFSTKMMINGDPHLYRIGAGPSSHAIASTRINIGSCFLQECVINGVDTVCLGGRSPSDHFGLFNICKQVDFNYSDSGYDLTNLGPVFPGAGALAAMVNDLGLPGTGCIAINLAETYAANLGNLVIPDSGYDFGKQLSDFADINCAGGFPGGNPACGFIPCTLPTYIAAIAIGGHSVPDAGVLLAADAVGHLAAPVAQYALAEIAVAVDIACGYVAYHCDGKDITMTILQNPAIQQAGIPTHFAQPPISSVLFPNPCRASVSAPPMNGNCWGGLIGWGKVACTQLDNDPKSTCDVPPSPATAAPPFPRLPIPGSAGADNKLAMRMCTTGRVVGLSMGYDGDLSFDVDNSFALVNYHNFDPGPGGTDAPNGVDVEMPWYSLGAITTSPGNPPAIVQVEALRKGMTVTVCGQWVADMHMLWNELHPASSLTIVSPKPTAVPNVIGEDPAVATQAIRARGFVVAQETFVDPTCRSVKIVASQTPVGGGLGYPGSTIVTIRVGVKPANPCP